MIKVRTGTRYLVQSGTIIRGDKFFDEDWRESYPPENDGWYSLWVDTPSKELAQYHTTGLEDRTWNDAEQRVEGPYSESMYRDKVEQDVLAQIPQYTVAQQVNDPSGVQAQVIKATAAAQEKLRELDDSADPAAVDPEIEIPDSGVGYALLSAEVTEQTPWVGTPSNIYGPDVRLEIQTEYEDQGSEARATVDIGGVLLPSLTFTQDTTNPKIWILSFPSDRLVADTGVVCKVALLWGAGSLRVGRELVLEGLGARSSGAVQYGVAGGTRF